MHTNFEVFCLLARASENTRSGETVNAFLRNKDKFFHHPSYNHDDGNNTDMLYASRDEMTVIRLFVANRDNSVSGFEAIDFGNKRRAQFMADKKHAFHFQSMVYEDDSVETQRARFLHMHYIVQKNARGPQRS